MAFPFVALLALAACGEEPEPVTDPDDLPRLGQRERDRDREREREAREAPAEQAEPAAETVAGDQRAPDVFVARLETTEGPIDIEVHREWAPHGADRFYTLVREGYFEDVAFFRVIDGFMAQAGIHGDPAVNARWRDRRIPDDPVEQSNTRGMVSFAMAGPGTRTTQFFINLVDNSRLDSMGFAPFGRVRDMSAVDALHSGYGEGAPRGRGPAQARIQREGNAYLRQEFPELDYIRRASIVEDAEGE
jgi:peptidyl-prolyl cis-trans isomerase A (cyclophilin A)